MAVIVIGADICPIEGNKDYFVAGNAKGLLNDLLPELEQADLSIANLECPLVEAAAPIQKTGPTFGEPAACLNGIKAAGIDVLCLANNHILDHGGAGLNQTLDACARAGIATVGAGANLDVARQLLIRDLEGLRVAILAVAEHEFSIAGSGSPGANPLDIIDFVRNVNARRKDFDYLVVLLHGSDEFFVPTPRIRDTCRFMVEMGANAVIVQHPHVLGGYEEYGGGHIVYGQGALLMDEAIYRDRASFHEGFLVKLTIASERASAMEIIPFVQSAPAPGARRMTEAEEKGFRHRLAQRAATIQDNALLRAEWRTFCEENKHDYLSGLLGHNRVLRKLNTSGWLTRFFYNPRVLLGVRNTVCCETHREAIQTIFDEKLL